MKREQKKRAMKFQILYTNIKVKKYILKEFQFVYFMIRLNKNVTMDIYSVF